MRYISWRAHVIKKYITHEFVKELKKNTVTVLILFFKMRLVCQNRLLTFAKT